MGDRHELTVSVAPKQDRGSVGLGGGGLAEPSVVTWATLTALADPSALPDPQTPAFPDQMLTWTRTPAVSPERRLWSISTSNSTWAGPFPSVAQSPQVHKSHVRL